MLPSAAWPRVSCVALLTCVASCFVLPCPTLYTFPEHRSRTSRGASAGVHPVRRAGATGPSAEEPPLVGCHRVGHRALVIRVTCVPGIGGRARYPAPHTRHGHRQSHGLVASQPCTLLASNTSSLLAANDANRAMVTSPDADVNGVLGALHRRNHSAAEASSGLRECEQYETVPGNGETIAAFTAWVTRTPYWPMVPSSRSPRPKYKRTEMRMYWYVLTPAQLRSSRTHYQRLRSTAKWTPVSPTSCDA